MNLDLREMTRRNGCFPGLEWWNAAYGEREVDYQDVLNRLAAEDRVDWARWLMHAIGAPDMLHDRGDVAPIAHGHGFFAGNLTLTAHVVVHGALLVAGRLQARNITADLIVAEGLIEALEIECAGNVICFGGAIEAASIKAENIRAGAAITVARSIAATGTVRAVQAIACPYVSAASVVEYCTGLVPERPRRGKAIPARFGQPQPAPKFFLEP